MDRVNIIIDDKKVSVSYGTSVLEAAKTVGIHIPTLCFLKEINEVASCRVCIVDVGGRLLTSCTLKAEEGMVVKTNTPMVREGRKLVVELLLSDHKRECTTCIRSENCELQSLAKSLNIRDLQYEGEKSKCIVDNSSLSVIRDGEKCILCGRCVNVCGKVQTVHAINFAERGFKAKISPAYEIPLQETTCTNCGQCILTCPVGALHEKENVNDVWDAIINPDKFVVVQTAPAVRIALGEEFAMPIGSRVTGKMVAALRRIGFDKVFDSNFAADLTIMEEGTELLKRLEKGENLPLFTSCCPGWVKFVEHNYPELLNNLSTCKSPSEMEGAMIKSYFAQKMGIDPKNIVTVSIMPCVGKKFENAREELSVDDLQDVDIVLTTRELASMIKESSVDFVNLDDETFDNPFGEGSGAGAIFAATGGVTEAALRTIFELTSGKELENIDFNVVRGLDGIKEAEVALPDGRKINAAVVNGLGNARKLIDEILSKEKTYQFIEVMACPGGCITGGGQPLTDPNIIDPMEVREKRANAIYEEDKSLKIRKSHKNPDIIKIYEEFLKEPNSHISHKYLHTTYVKRNKF